MRLFTLIHQFAKCNQGVAAIEFALVLPFLMILSFGGFEISRYLLITQKLDRIAYTVTDVTTQSTSLTQAQLDLIFVAASEIMKPYEFEGEGVIMVSSVYTPDTNPARIRWQYAGGGEITRESVLGEVGDIANLPDGFTLNPRDNIIISEVFYQYKPLLDLSIMGPRDIYKTVIFKPRLGALTTPPS